jgi:hypothetical protein
MESKCQSISTHEKRPDVSRGHSETWCRRAAAKENEFGLAVPERSMLTTIISADKLPDRIMAGTSPKTNGRHTA